MHNLESAYSSWGYGQAGHLTPRPRAKGLRPRRGAPSVSETVMLRRLEEQTPLSDIERGLLCKLSVFRECIQTGDALTRPGKPVVARIIIAGWACRQRTLPDGRRQIFNFLIPGDALGLTAASSPLEEVSTVALTRVECVDAMILKEILSAGDERHSRLQRALGSARRQEHAALLDHIMRLGRQSALERLCHFFLEMRDRTRAAGLAESDERFPLPLTQEVLADALGLSIVHLNRTLQQMKRDGLMHIHRGWLELHDTHRMELLADYGPHDG